MPKILFAWMGGTLLCISVAAAASLLGNEPLSVAAWGGITCVVTAHVATGYLAVEPRTRSASGILSLGLVMIWTLLQLLFGLALCSKFAIELPVLMAAWLLATGVIGQCALLAATSRFVASPAAINPPSSPASARG